VDAGLEWLIDAKGCSPALLSDLSVLQEVCRQIVRDQNLHVVGEPVWHQFGGPGGVTGMLLLSESHLTCHTYPEHALATFNLYCCRRRAPWPWQARMRSLLGAEQVVVQSVVRGGELPDRNAALLTSIEQARN
jgi:S-adenosylmethionine decarboxylase